MATTKSDWRRRARLVIAGVLASLPPGTSLAAKRKAVSAAYPWGERAMHPYKCWLAEVRLALGDGRDRTRARTVRVVVDTSFGLPVPRVACSWCKCGMPGYQYVTGGCVACSERIQQVRRQREATDWKAWTDWERLLGEDDEPVTRLAFADWLEENGWPDDAARVRRGE